MPISACVKPKESGGSACSPTRDRYGLGLEASAAVDTLWLLMSPNNYYRLVHERGWTKAEHQRGLADTIKQLLLPAHP